MDIVATLLILGSMVGFGICVLKLVVNAIKRKPLKKAMIALGVMVVLFFVGVFIMPISETTSLDDAVPTESNATESTTIAITEPTEAETLIVEGPIETEAPTIEQEDETVPPATEAVVVTEPTEEVVPPTTVPETQPVTIGVRDESLEGRGRSDSGRSEPQYVGIIGYAVNWGESYYDNEEYLSGNWTVPVYEKDKQFYNEVGTIAHKTEVLVLSQELEHEGWGRYSGYLTVEDTATKEQYIIDVSSFITKPYWTYDDLLNAVSVGHFIAEFNQVSDYYPVDKSSEKVELEDGIIVHVIRKTGTYGKNGPDDETNQIEAIVFKEWQYGYGGVSVFFNVDDLRLTY